MWESIIESGIIALVFGFVTSITGIIISNNYAKKRELLERKYEITQEIYRKLVLIYERQMERNSIKKINKKSILDIYENAIIEVYNDADRKHKELKKSYMEIKYILEKKDIKKLEDEFNQVEKIGKILFDTSFNSKIKEKRDYSNLQNNEDIILIEEEKIPEYMRLYIDKVNKLETNFIEVIENKLRALLK